MAIRGRLQTQDRIMKWNSNNDMKCPLSNKVNDSHRHIFFECEFSSSIWDEMRKRMEDSNMPTIWDEVIDHYISRPCNNSISSVLNRIILATSVYYLWRERNSRLFAGEIQNEETVEKIIVESIRLQLLGLKVKKSVKVNKEETIWMMEMNVCRI